MDLFKTWLVETPIAHRGFHDKNAPENSLAAFKNAIEKGYAIELDVRLISDGTVVVFHDESLSRMTGNDGYIKFLTKNDLELIHLNNSEEKIPTLTEVLEFVNGQVPLLIEIKNNDKVGELEKRFIEIMEGYKGEYAVQSFNPLALNYIKNHAPHMIRGQLAGYLKNSKLTFFKKFLAKRMMLNKKYSEPHFISYEAKHLPNRYVKKYKNLPLLAWTINSQDEYMHIVKHCDNIIFQNFIPTI
ncbi:MAG: glycerophosphodiester phosphodiesterase [Clostridia bacterium]|nr:glycerophosphodiester phosphodiesterase [Clostridia bacterium]